jgi:predicted MFS family arabinose efflux permease
LLLSLVSLLVLPYNSQLPVFAKVVFKGDAATYGYINSFIGLGAVCGTFFLASLKQGSRLKRVLLVNTVLLGLGLILFSRISYFPLAMFVTVICGLCTMIQTTICLTIIQVDTDARLRGRVMSFVAMGYFGMLPLGSLLIGWVSQHTSAPVALLCQGIMALVLAGVFYKFLKADRPPAATHTAVEAAETIVTEELNKEL